MAPNVTIRNRGYIQNVKISPNQGTLEGYKIAEAFDDVGGAVSNVANQLASSPDGTPITPPNVGAFQAKHIGSGTLHFSITDNGKIQRAINYVVELSDNPSFSNSQYVHFSPSRNGFVPNLPNGSWYMKAYSQYQHGGPPSSPVVHGPIVVAGSSSTGLLSSQGSGTGAPGQTNQGAGVSISR